MKKTYHKKVSKRALLPDRAERFYNCSTFEKWERTCKKRTKMLHEFHIEGIDDSYTAKILRYTTALVIAAPDGEILDEVAHKLSMTGHECW